MEGMERITIDNLLSLCGYGVHIKVKRADNGKVVIDSVNALKNSKDKRQQAKWEAFKDKEVFGIRPSAQVECIKRNDPFIWLTIEVWISSAVCERAVAEYKATVS